MTKSALKTDDRNTFDYIVVGAGSAGSVVAARLSENPGSSVLLLEAGEWESSLYIGMPLAYRILRTKNLFDWGYASETESGANGRSVDVPRGKLLGGSSSINGMMYSRGHPRDYDGWAQAGASGWSFDDVLPYFKKSERSWRGETDRHGGSGPLSVSQLKTSDPLTTAMHEAAERKGYRVIDDFERDDPDGFALPDLTIRNGRRESAATAFLASAKRRANLKIWRGARVAELLYEGRRVTGLRYLSSDGRMVPVGARREVILCGGTYASPQLLMLSGIGPAAHLREMGVSVRVDLTDVGLNLQDHICTPMMFSCQRPLEFGRSLRLDRITRSAIAWRLFGKGPAAGIPLTSIAYHRSRPELDRTDLENIFLPTSMAARTWFPGWRTAMPDVLTSINVVLRPESRGSVRLASADPRAAPRIHFNLLDKQADMDRLKYSVDWTRDLMRQAPLTDFIAEELFPGPDKTDEAELEEYARQTVNIGHHATSTCAIGKVVDQNLRVHGVEGLRVADASVMPELIGGHTNAPAIMIGEKAADMIAHAHS